MTTRTTRAPVDQVLKAAFDKVEAQPTPEALKVHVDRLTEAGPGRKAKN